MSVRDVGACSGAFTTVRTGATVGSCTLLPRASPRQRSCAVGSGSGRTPLPAVPPIRPNAFADNALAAVLGQRLFFDKALSGAIVIGDDGTNGGLGAVGEIGKVACVSCHASKATAATASEWRKKVARAEILEAALTGSRRPAVHTGRQAGTRTTRRRRRRRWLIHGS